MSTIRDPLIILSNYLQCASKLVMFVNNDTPVSTTLLTHLTTSVITYFFFSGWELTLAAQVFKPVKL